MGNSEKLIDPIYHKFRRSIMRTLASSEFYDFFMETIAQGENEFQFSNRRLDKYVDTTWIEAIEEALDGFENIVMNPRNIIREDEIIVNVAHAKKAGPDVIRHLAQHGSMIEHFNEETGEVRPSKLMQKIREDSTEFYENRLAYTVLEDTYHFVQIRHNALLDALSEEHGAKLKVTSDIKTAREDIHMDSFIHIKENDSVLQTDEKQGDVLNRISRLYRILSTYMNSQFSESLRACSRVRGNIVKTNVLKNNPNYRKVVKLWEFLRSYDSVGYWIDVIEQNPYIDQRFEQDIYHNIMFQYVILKAYLEMEEQRKFQFSENERKRQLKPKVILEIIEELVEDYDLPDVEIRKVLIEELTKEQLMKEEGEERLRLVEEQEKRRIEEEERLRQEEEQRRLEALAEEERLLEEQRLREEEEERIRLKQELDDRRKRDILYAEFEYFKSKLEERLDEREDELAKLKELDPISDFAKEAARVEAEERRKQQAEERMRQMKAAEEARQIRMEKERQQRELRKKEEELARQKKAEEEALFQQALTVVSVYLEEAKRFQEMLPEQQKERVAYEVSQQLAMETARLERKQRQEQKKDAKQGLKWRFGIR